MVIETQLLPFLEWIQGGVLVWLAIAGITAVLCLGFGYLVAALRNGPVAAMAVTGRALAGWLGDVAGVSPRRLWALTRLSIREALRRRIVVVFGLFIVILMFAGWFLDPSSEQPVRLYLGFVLTATSYMVLALVLFLSVFSIPNDLRSKTLYTIVTKPVRPSEIVLGRMLGFIAIGTLLLVVMGLMSYVFVRRGLDHSHEVRASDLAPIEHPFKDPSGPRAEAELDAAGGLTLMGRSSTVRNHYHDVLISPRGVGRLDTAQGHRHRVEREGTGKEATYRVGPPEGMLVARVPLYGTLRFLDSQGKETDKGVNVGDEWTYRGYIDGGTLAAAVWTFDGVTPESFPEKLQVEMTLGVFRTYKGTIAEGIPGSLLVRNPATGLAVEAKIFRAREFNTDVQYIHRKITPTNVYYLKREVLPDGSARYVRQDLPAQQKAQSTYDLFEDLTDGGRTEIWLQCLAPMQYLGAAQADMYLWAGDAPFAWNFAKGYFGIWMQMVLVVAFGVMFSTFLGGPVAMIATVGVLVGGLLHPLVLSVAEGTMYGDKPNQVNLGGGPIESMIRMVTQQNVVVEMDESFRTTAAQTADPVLQAALWVIAQVLPNFGQYSAADYVAYGFNISGDWLAERGVTTLGFFVVLVLVSCLFMKVREVAK